MTEQGVERHILALFKLYLKAAFKAHNALGKTLTAFLNFIFLLWQRPKTGYKEATSSV